MKSEKELIYEECHGTKDECDAYFCKPCYDKFSKIYEICDKKEKCPYNDSDHSIYSMLLKCPICTQGKINVKILLI